MFSSFLARFAAPSSPFEPPTLLYQLRTTPLRLIISQIHHSLVALRGPPFPAAANPISIVCLSDTHTNTLDVPHGDVLIHAGDLANRGTVSEIQAQIDWIDSLPHTHKVVIAGNHDSFLDPRSRRSEDKESLLAWKGVQYLQHSDTILKFPNRGDRQLKLYGAPQIPACGGKDFAFQYQRHEDTWRETVPGDVDVLITHTPPRWHGDLPRGMGCDFLLKEVWRVKPRLHVFGHVHGARGTEGVFWDPGQQAYERISNRQSWWALLRLTVWIDVLRVLVHGVLGILWMRIWGAEGEGSIMVNAGVVDWKTRLKYGAQVVEI